MLVKALRMGKVYLYSTGISASDRALTYAPGVRSPEDGFSHAVSAVSGRPRVAIIPEGPYVIPLR